MQRINFNRKRKSLVDEVNNTFSGTRVSDVISITDYKTLDHDWTTERALEKVLAGAGEYNADAYELVSLKSERDFNGTRQSLFYTKITVSVIFYESARDIKGEE